MYNTWRGRTFHSMRAVYIHSAHSTASTSRSLYSYSSLSSDGVFFNQHQVQPAGGGPAAVCIGECGFGGYCGV